MVKGGFAALQAKVKIVNRVDIFRLTNEELWRGLKDLSSRERVLAADIVAYVAETQRRKLHEDHGWTSMFDYCVRSLGWSEATAFRRTRAARAVIAFPAILEMLYDGRLSIDAVVILYAFLDDNDFPSLLLKSAGKTAKEIEWLVADRRTEPALRDVMCVVGVQPAPAAPPEGEESLSWLQEPRRVEIPPCEVPASAKSPKPLPPPASVPRLFRVAFTADEVFQGMVLRAQQLMRHKYPDGRLEGIFGDALRLLIEKKDLGVRAAAAAARRMRRKG